MIVLATLAAAQVLKSSPDLGKAEGRCRTGESGAAFIVDVEGLKDRAGLLKLELYPLNDDDWLADDSVLITAGKVFRRVEIEVPKRGPVEMCIRAPAAGTYSLSILHDRNGDHRFALSSDGVGFAGNPKLGWSKPKAAAAAARTGDRPTRIHIRMNYRRGLFAFGPIER